MEKHPSVDKWPEVPEELKYAELRLPGTFRELVANRNLTHEEIGRIVRCIALNTEEFDTPRIHPEVHYYTRHQKLKLKVKKRVDALRKRKLGVSNISTLNIREGVTVTQESGQPIPGEGAKSPSEKTPSIQEEKRPPIVPLEKKTPSPLEKQKRGRRKRSTPEGDLQQDLFALAESTCSSGINDNAQRTPQERSVGPTVENPLQDIESDSRGAEGPSATMPTSNDSRADAAWIPPRFALFWEKYPKKVAKQAAMKAFAKLIKSQDDVEGFMRTMMASLEWWKKQANWNREGGKYIPHPATWLNRGSWEDSVDNNDQPTGQAEFLDRNSETEEDLIRRMTGG